MSPRTGARRRLGSIRLSLILLALVPSVALTTLWGVTTTQMFTEGLRLRGQTELSQSTGAMGTDATLALQRERSLSAALLASPRGSRAALDAQRAETDRAVAKLVGQSDAIAKAPSRISDQLYSVLGSVGSLEYYRDQVDDPTDITPAQVLDQYSSIIDDQVHAFQELSQVDDGDLTSQAGPLVALEHAAELVSQEDARLTLAWPTGHLGEKEWIGFAQLVDAHRWLVEDQIVPQLTGSAKTQTERILQGPEWRTLTDIEDQVLAARTRATDGKVVLPDAQKKWTAALDKVAAAYTRLIQDQTSGLLDRSADKADSLLLTAASLSAGGLFGLLLCVGMSWRITRSLSRRLHGLREATLSLAEERLPDVVSRLERGETVDADLAAPPLDYGSDELGAVARAFNKAQRTAVHTAIELADTRRGFQKVILGIARQSQNLVNLQLTKLDALERRHTDPEVLKGLYELDSTASQLRRYEENLVVISGERPGRSWQEPVALIDILRSAVGEVAEYQRVEVHTEEDVYLAPPAVADVIHLLAELIDNATVYSPAPAPVTVQASSVAKGLAVEVEDRGLGMSEEDYASLNSQLAVPPKFDVVALADDLRLGMFVIGRLATRHGIAVTLRPSPYGGTTAIVLLPQEIVVRDVTDTDVPGTREATGPGTTWGTTASRARIGTGGPVRHTDEPAVAGGTLELTHAATGVAVRGGTADIDESGPRRGAPTEAPAQTNADAGALVQHSITEADGPGVEQGALEPASTNAEGLLRHGDSGTDGTDGARGATTGAAELADSDAGVAVRHGSTDTGTPGVKRSATGGPTELGDSDAGVTARYGGTDTGTPGVKRSATTGAPGQAIVDDRVPVRQRPTEATGPDRQVRDAETSVPPLPARRRGAQGGSEHSRAGETDRPGGPRVPGDVGRAGEVGHPGRRPGMAPLPRRVPQTSLAVELREDAAPAEQEGSDEEFTAERAASSLAGFQRGTFRARGEDAEASDGQEPEKLHPQPSTPTDAPYGQEETTTPDNPGPQPPATGTDTPADR
ncbi:nitrate- and nitrite sensing domain-containing protein [Streptomyces sp. NBC_00140]|uniref:sensor histidine kinase n=1 Tax=Streptomyces sp. NBC_00140 TaxID=2975664 RepID=UPI00225BB840|nr:nitrate- and nitrite sensing domain-containing protein [Streptomyces sp. NBC_00140]MCX5330633.1 nitrate- and nitrite sensing domain-containing protein [Streptomyces sp. NBC_00140]